MTHRTFAAWLRLVPMAAWSLKRHLALDSGLLMLVFTQWSLRMGTRQ
jgi:hypothetical protein